jgi:hypothetical protein
MNKTEEETLYAIQIAKLNIHNKNMHGYVFAIDDWHHWSFILEEVIGNEVVNAINTKEDIYKKEYNSRLEAEKELFEFYINYIKTQNNLKINT